MTINGRLLLILVLAITFPAIVLGIYFFQEHEDAADLTRQNLFRLAAIAQQTLEDDIANTSQLLFGLARARDLNPDNETACSTFLADVFKQNSQYTGIVALAPDGSMVCDSLRTGHSLNVADRAYFQSALVSANQVSLEPAFGRLTGLSVLQIAYPARDASGKVTLVLVASLNLTQYARTFSKTLPDAHLEFVLADHNGTVLAWMSDPARPNVVTTSIVGTPQFALAKGTGTGEGIDSHGVEWVWGAATLLTSQETGLHLMVGISRENVSIAADRILFNAVSAVIVASILMLLGAYLVARFGVQRPLKRLAQAEQDIRDREIRMGAILETVIDGIITIDARGRIETVNPAAARLFGYSADEVIGQNVNMLMPDPYESEHGGYIQRFRETGEANSIGIRKDASTFPMELAVSQMEVRGEQMYTAVARDITFRKTLEDDLRAAKEESEAANRAKSQFLASMSHEIRTPLNGIIGNLDLLALTELDGEQYALLDDADKAGKSLLALIGNILDFSKIEAGKFIFETGEVDIATVVRDAVNVLQSLARQKGIFLVWTVAADVPQLVRCDGPRIRQVLLNLIGNAIKFTSHGGVLVDLSVAATDHSVCELHFAVHDSGKGFDQALADKLFAPFTQDHSDMRAVEGTGLGLAISRSLVNNFGGAIGCEGVAGEGATFWFTLPAAVAKLAVPPARPDLSGYTVVMVDEWAGAAPWLAAYFRTRGAAVVVTRTLPASIADPGPGATEKARQSNVVIFFTPDAEGFSPETSRHIRQQHFVPLIQGPTASAHNYRLALRAGFAALLPTAMDTDYLDRNIRLLMGHAPVRTWHDTDGIPSLGLDAQSLKEKRFLVLEDRLANQTIIQKQLRKLGIACTLVPNGLRGLDALKQERFDLILCDCSMPEMNGYDFTRAVRRQEAAAQDGRRIPIIAMTANAFREDAEQCFEAGMDDFISKPVTLARMATVLRSWLNPAAEVSESGNPVPMDVAERSRAIDMDLLAEMLGTDDRTELDEILTLFLPVARASLADMEKALSSGCAEAIAAAAHGAKGEAQSAAAIGLAGVYAEIERQTKGGNIDGLGAFGALAAAEVRRVEEFVGGQSDR